MSELSQTTSARVDTLPAATVRAPGRLHLGFLDPGGSLGRRFGSLGLVIHGFETVVTVGAASRDTVSAASPAAQAEAGRASAHLHQLRERSGLGQPLHLGLEQVLPPHAGFGSGTQLALAVGHAFVRCHRLAIDTATLASWLGRGVRSGIGIAGFDHGGLLLDGGPDVDGSAAPLLSRIVFPEAWRIVVVIDRTHRGLSGPQEKAAIAALAPMPQATAADICHQVLMRVLPGAACGDFEAFAAGVTRLQQRLGEHFAPAQGGSGYTSAAVGRLVLWLGDHAAAIGQSSWGPTGFAVLPSLARAQALLAAAQAANRVDPALEIHIVRGRNHGADID